MRRRLRRMGVLPALCQRYPNFLRDLPDLTRGELEDMIAAVR